MTRLGPIHRPSAGTHKYLQFQGESTPFLNCGQRIAPRAPLRYATVEDWSEVSNRFDRRKLQKSN